MRAACARTALPSLLALVAGCSATPTRARGTAGVEDDFPTVVASMTASAAVVQEASGLRLVVSNLMVSADACEAARVLETNGLDDEASVFVVTVDVPGPGSFSTATGASATVHVADFRCASIDEQATAVTATLEQDGDAFRGSIHAVFPSGQVLALLNAALCADAGQPSDAGASCTQYPACVDGSVGACITTP